MDFKYELIEPSVGEGPLGTVHKAIDLSNGKLVAFKQISPSDGISKTQMLGRLERIAATLNSLKTGDIARVLEVGEYKGNGYIVREFVDAKSLNEMLQDGNCDTRKLLGTFTYVGVLLEDAHKYGVYHGGIRPGNIFVKEDGDVVLTDFLVGNEFVNYTSLQSDAVQYLSPRRLEMIKRGSSVIDQDSDIYSMGILLFYALTGKLPFKQNDPSLILKKIHSENPVKSHPNFKKIDKRLQDVILRSTGNSAARYGSITKCLDGISQVSELLDPQGEDDEPQEAEVAAEGEGSRNTGPGLEAKLDDAFDEGYDSGFNKGYNRALKDTKKSNMWTFFMLGLLYLATLAAAGSAVYYFATQNGLVRKNPVQPPVINVPENEAVDALKKRIGDLEDKNRELWEELNEEEKNGK